MESNMETYVTVCKADGQQDVLHGSGNSNGPCTNLEGWEGVQKGGDAGKPMAESC